MGIIENGRRPLWRRLLWMGVIWTASVIVLGLASSLIKLWLRP